MLPPLKSKPAQKLRQNPNYKSSTALVLYKPDI